MLFTGLFLTVFLAVLSPLRPYIIGIMVGDYVRLGQEDNLFFGALLVVGLLILESFGQKGNCRDGTRQYFSKHFGRGFNGLRQG